MTHPIDIIANAIRVADGNHTMGAGQLAGVAANALTDHAIINHAVAELRESGFHHMDSDDLETITRIVLGSVGG